MISLLTIKICDLHITTMYSDTPPTVPTSNKVNINNCTVANNQPEKI
jgi:hypothetical protein